jgi:uncharacterized damage-inducible protein DinB
MDLPTQLRTLIAYNEWANGKVLAAFSGLSHEQLTRKSGASFESVRGNMVHVLSAQNSWLTRQGSPPPDAATDTHGGLAAAFAASHAAMRGFAAGLDAAAVTRTVHYTDSDGDPHSLPLWLVVTHVVNHGTFHRGETGMLLAAMDRSPGDMDLVYWALEQQ